MGWQKGTKEAMPKKGNHVPQRTEIHSGVIEGPDGPEVPDHGAGRDMAAEGSGDGGDNQNEGVSRGEVGEGLRAGEDDFNEAMAGGLARGSLGVGVSEETTIGGSNVRAKEKGQEKRKGKGKGRGKGRGETADEEVWTGNIIKAATTPHATHLLSRLCLPTVHGSINSG